MVGGDRGGGERVSDRVVQLVSDPITFGQLQFTFFRQREPFSRVQMDEMVALGVRGIEALIAMQKAVIAEVG